MYVELPFAGKPFTEIPLTVNPILLSTNKLNKEILNKEYIIPQTGICVLRRKELDLLMNKKYEFDTNDAMNAFAAFICDMIAKYGDQIDFDSLYSPYEMRMRKIWKKISVMYQTAALSRTLK